MVERHDYYNDDDGDGSKNTQQHLVLQGDAYDMFINALRTKATKRLYVIGLGRFMAFQNAQYVSDLLGRTSTVADAPLIQSRIIQWIVHLKNVENVPSSTLQSYLAGVMKFYTMNDIILNKDKIHSYLPANRKLNNDTRGYTRNEIAKLLSFCGPRERALVLLLASTGMRVEAAAELKIKHLHKNEQYKLYKIVVYQGDPHEYICYTTPEAAQAIDDYFAFRRRHGEKISVAAATEDTPTPETPLIREEFNINDLLIARHPNEMNSQALGDIIRYKLRRSGLVEREPLKEGQKRGQKRNKIPRTHGFRRYVITTMTNLRINETIRNLLTDHSVKLDKNYYYPTEDELLQEYLKVVDELTIDKSKRLERENEMLKVKKSEYESLKEQLEQHKEAQAARDERLRERLYRLSKKLLSEQEEEGTIPLSPEEKEEFEHAMNDD